MSQHRTDDDGATERPGAADEISAAVTGEPLAEPRDDYDPERRDAAGAPLPGDDPDYDPERRDAAGAPLPGDDPGDMEAHGGSIAGGQAHP